jgi:hypothetical protein
LLEVEYYDSIVENTKKKRYNIFNPLEERVITYEYEPFANHSSWLYIRSPQNFNLSIDTSKIISDQYKMEHDNTSDPEIRSLTIVSYSDVNENVQFNIEITVPTSLKTWFLSIYSIFFVVLIILGLHLLNKLWINIFGALFSIGDIFGNIVNQSYFENIVLALVARIIATRGWLISEETILKSYSKYITYMMLLLLILFAISRITAFYT